MHACIHTHAHTHSDTHAHTVLDGLPSFNCHAFPRWPHLVAFLSGALASLFTSKLCAWPADCTFTSPCYPATAALVLGPPEIHSQHRTQWSLKTGWIRAPHPQPHTQPVRSHSLLASFPLARKGTAAPSKEPLGQTSSV